MTIQLLTGDARDVLPTLPADSVHCVVCSPPYYALRSYLDASHPDKHREIGSEATPEAYLAAMVQVFREVRRVLRPDGTCWVNIGDSYNANQGSGFNGNAGKPTASPKAYTGLAAKQLLLMPARLALALQADGWWVRSDIIWHKPNPMPESCTDRPTSAHEHVFLLTKSARYYYDAEGTKEAVTGNQHPGRLDGGIPVPRGGGVDTGGARQSMPCGLVTSRNMRNVWTLATHAFPEAHFATYPPELVERCIKAGTSERGCCAACGKPWVREIQATGGILGKSWHPHEADAVKGNAPRLGIHNAERDGLVPPYQRTTTGWSPGCKCREIPAPGCDASVSQGHSEPRNAREQGDDVAAVNSLAPASTALAPVPCTVLDPFVGSGTTALVADRLQRHAIGIDLSLTYAEMAQRRIEMDCPLFTSWAPAEDPEEARMRDLFAEAAE